MHTKLSCFSSFKDLPDLHFVWLEIPERKEVPAETANPLDRLDLTPQQLKDLKKDVKEEVGKKDAKKLLKTFYDRLTGAADTPIQRRKEAGGEHVRRGKYEKETEVKYYRAKEKGPRIYLHDTVDVLLLQALLSKLGFTDDEGKKLSLDGVWGDKTQAAVKAFQENAGIKADGEFGNKTFEAMHKFIEKDRKAPKKRRAQAEKEYEPPSIEAPREDASGTPRIPTEEERKKLEINEQIDDIDKALKEMMKEVLPDIKKLIEEIDELLKKAKDEKLSPEESLIHLQHAKRRLEAIPSGFQYVENTIKTIKRNPLLTRTDLEKETKETINNLKTKLTDIETYLNEKRTEEEKLRKNIETLERILTSRKETSARKEIELAEGEMTKRLEQPKFMTPQEVDKEAQKSLSEIEKSPGRGQIRPEAIKNYIRKKFGETAQTLSSGELRALFYLVYQQGFYNPLKKEMLETEAPFGDSGSILAGLEIVDGKIYYTPVGAENESPYPVELKPVGCNIIVKSKKGNVTTTIAINHPGSDRETGIDPKIEKARDSE